MKLSAWIRGIAPRASLMAAVGLIIGTASSEIHAQHGRSVSDVLGAVFELEARTPADARTARTLGVERGGSAVLIDSDGLVLTIGYLILEAEEVTLKGRSGERYPAVILGFDHDSGLGLLRATGLPDDLEPLPLGSADGARVNTEVLVISHGGRTGVRPARVIDRREFAGYWEYLIDDAIFTAPIHPRFGGAALLGPDGRLLGVGSLQVPDARQGDSPVAGNMFVPVDLLAPVFADLLEGRRPEPVRPWLGATFEESRGHLFVTGFSPEGPALAAGLERNDIIVAVDQEPVNSLAGFYRALWGLGSAGVDVPLKVLRGGQIVDLTVVSRSRYDWLRLSH